MPVKWLLERSSQLSKYHCVPQVAGISPDSSLWASETYRRSLNAGPEPQAAGSVPAKQMLHDSSLSVFKHVSELPLLQMK